MDRLLALLAPFAVLLPGTPVDGPPPLQSGAATADAPELMSVPSTAPALDDSPLSGWNEAADSFRAPVENQVRIEQRITIRISPRAAPQPSFLDLPEWMPSRPIEREMGRCVPVSGIAAVQVGRKNRLLLFMRDQRIIAAGLEKACRALDFYSGFYVERNADGQLCAERDHLQSRSGANCTLTRLHQLVPGR